MHFLDRAAVQAPACLAEYDHATQTWDDFGGACKAQLRAALVSIQGIPGVTTDEAEEYGVRCAYCESAIHHEGHIEHFRRKNPAHFPELTFAWVNLFLVCGSRSHCGHFKDRKGAPPYDPARLIKPDEDDPEKFLYFHSTGEVRVRAGLRQLDDQQRAHETIKAFGLDSPALSGQRSTSISLYKKKVLGDLDEIASWPQQDREDYLLGEIQATCWEPYATTIKHFLMKHI